MRMLLIQILCSTKILLIYHFQKIRIRFKPNQHSPNPLSDILLFYQVFNIDDKEI